MPANGAPTVNEIRNVARATANALKDNGLQCCLFGSTACWFYGVKRVPNDVDMVVLTEEHNIEEAKQILAETNPRFFLTDSSNPNNTYKILWYSLPSLPNRPPRACKVDILAPGTMGVPSILPRHIVFAEDDIPVMPLSAVLLLKLQGWTDHRNHWRKDFQAKQHIDVNDINQLLDVAIQDYILDVRRDDWLPEWFINDGLTRMQKYIEIFPESAEDWIAVGMLD